MARKPMVTRTIVTTKVAVMALDITTGEPSTISVALPRTYSDEKKILKAVQDTLEPNIKAVHVVAQEEVETLYGMSEQDFISHASILDPETRKMLETDEQ